MAMFFSSRDTERVLIDGGRIVLEYYPGNPGRVGPEGDVVDDPEPDGFTATAYTPDGAQAAFGGGPTPVEALTQLAPSDTAPDGPFSTQLPF